MADEEEPEPEHTGYMPGDADWDSETTGAAQDLDPTDDPGPYPGAGGGGGGGASELWISGAAFAGNGNGYGTPGGAGELAAYTYTAGTNRFGMTTVGLPAGWENIAVDVYCGTAWATPGNIVFEMNWQLATPGTVLDGDANPETVSIPSDGAGQLSIGEEVLTIENLAGARALNLKIRSNNATQEVAGEVWLMGVMLRKVEPA